MKLHALASTTRLNIGASVLVALSLGACGGGGGGGGGNSAPPPTTPATMHTVTITWTANREAAVNSPGGGYKVNISGQPQIDCPFSGFATPCTSPTSVQVSLLTGAYTVTVVAYSALNAPGKIGSTSLPSASVPINVP